MHSHRKEERMTKWNNEAMNETSGSHQQDSGIRKKHRRELWLSKEAHVMRGAMDAAVVGKRKYASARRTVRHCRRGELLGKVARPDTRSPASDCSFLLQLCLSFLTSTMQYVYPFRYESTSDLKGKLCPFLGACTGHSFLSFSTWLLLSCPQPQMPMLMSHYLPNSLLIATAFSLIDFPLVCLFVLTISV